MAPERSSRHGRESASTLAALEALAYDEDSRVSTPPSITGQHSPADNVPSRGGGVRFDTPYSAKDVEGRTPWGWETRLLSAKEDLRQLKRRKSRSSAATVLSAEAEADSVQEPKEMSLRSAFATPEPLRGASTFSGDERHPGFGERWASSVLLTELAALKKELRLSNEREAQLRHRLADAERDKDTICHLWEADRAKFMGMKQTVQCAFLAANEELQQRLFSRRPDFP